MNSHKQFDFKIIKNQTPCIFYTTNIQILTYLQISNHADFLRRYTNLRALHISNLDYNNKCTVIRTMMVAKTPPQFSPRPKRIKTPSQIVVKLVSQEHIATRSTDPDFSILNYYLTTN